MNIKSLGNTLIICFICNMILCPTVYSKNYGELVSRPDSNKSISNNLNNTHLTPYTIYSDSPIKSFYRGTILEIISPNLIKIEVSLGFNVFYQTQMSSERPLNDFEPNTKIIIGVGEHLEGYHIAILISEDGSNILTDYLAVLKGKVIIKE